MRNILKLSTFVCLKPGRLVCQFLLVATSPFFLNTSANGYELGSNSFKANIPAGIYLYKTTPDMKQNVFSILWVITNKQIVDPLQIIKKGGVDSLQSYLRGNKFDVFNGKTMIGEISSIELQTTNICGRTGFPEYPNVVGFYQGKVLRPFELMESRFGRGQRIYTASRIIALPHASLTGVTYQQTTEMERGQVVHALQNTVVQDLLHKVSTELMRAWGAEYKVVGEGDSGLTSLEKVDIDNNGKADFIGTYHLSARYGDSEDYSVSNSVLFAFLNGRDVVDVTFAGGADGYKLIGIIDINLDGLSEIIYEAKIPSKTNGGDPGRRIHILSYDGTKFHEVYRSGVTCNGNPYEF